MKAPTSTARDNRISYPLAEMFPFLPLMLWMICLLFGAPAPAQACGSSCECPGGSQCAADATCQPKGSVAGPGVHPVCCNDSFCTPEGQVCENPDGSVGTCTGGGCVPLSCSTMGKECGSAEDSCGGTVQCGACPDGATCS